MVTTRSRDGKLPEKTQRYGFSDAGVKKTAPVKRGRTQLAQRGEPGDQHVKRPTAPTHTYNTRSKTLRAGKAPPVKRVTKPKKRKPVAGQVSSQRRPQKKPAARSRRHLRRDPTPGPGEADGSSSVISSPLSPALSLWSPSPSPEPKDPETAPGNLEGTRRPDGPPKTSPRRSPGLDTSSPTSTPVVDPATPGAYQQEIQHTSDETVRPDTPRPNLLEDGVKSRPHQPDALPGSDGFKIPSATSTASPATLSKAPSLDRGPTLGQNLRPPFPATSSWRDDQHHPLAKPLPKWANRCYRVALLQSLISTPQFFNILDNPQNDAQCPESCVTCALRGLVRTYQDPAMGNVSVRIQLGSVDRAIRMQAQSAVPSNQITTHLIWTSNRRAQEDAHDFLLYVLGNMGVAPCVRQHDFRRSFNITHATVWLCDSCQSQHRATEPSGFDMTVAIHPRNGRATLDTCLTQYHLETDLEIRCDQCGDNGRRTRARRIVQLPEVMLLHLARFESDLNGRTSKVEDQVAIPDNIHMGLWSSIGLARDGYQLQAVVYHSGDLTSGHYVVRFRTPQGIAHANDSRPIRYVEDFWDDLGQFTPYILLYLRG